MTISKDGYEYTKDYTLNIDAEAEETTPVYYPVSSLEEYNFRLVVKLLSCTTSCRQARRLQFKFYNYSDEV